MKEKSWYGRCINANDGMTRNKVYKITETRDSKHSMRPVEVINDNGDSVSVFAARFETMPKNYTPITELVNDQNYITVHTNERFLRGQTGRIVSKKVLQNAVIKNCHHYQEGTCKACLMVDETKEQEIECLTAWKITTGKGKKLY